MSNSSSALDITICPQTHVDSAFLAYLNSESAREALGSELFDEINGEKEVVVEEVAVQVETAVQEVIQQVEESQVIEMMDIVDPTTQPKEIHICKTKQDSALDLTPTSFGMRVALGKIRLNRSTRHIPIDEVSIKNKLIKLFINPNQKFSQSQFIPITHAFNLPRYMNRAFFAKCSDRKMNVDDDADDIQVDFNSVLKIVLQLCKYNKEEFAWRVLNGNIGGGVCGDDLKWVVYDVVSNHPGLKFLKGQTLFQRLYVETIITRLYFSKPSSCTEKFTLPEFIKTDFLGKLTQLESEPDINANRDLFSYKHFFVIYCKFWELDTNHTLHLTFPEFNQFDPSLLPRAKSRICNGIPKPLSSSPPSAPPLSFGAMKAVKGMSYADFVYFLLANEDKNSVSGIEYWFRVLDGDGDGVISWWEVRAFWEESRSGDKWGFEDLVCSLIDLIKPTNPMQIRLSDLKRSDNAALFFDMIVDGRKYESHVRRIDPFFREMDDVWVTGKDGRVKLEGWQKYAERAYDIMSTEEVGESVSYDNNVEEFEELLCIDSHKKREIDEMDADSDDE